MLCRSLLAVFLLGLVAAGDRPASADEPKFLGRTRKDWVAELDASAGRRRRNQAAWALAEMATREATPSDTMIWLNELFLLCESDSPAVRYWGQLGVQRFVGRLAPEHPGRVVTLKLLSDAVTDSALAVRLVAAETLVKLGSPNDGLPVLTDALKNPQESVRIQAIDALARLGPAARPVESTIRAATSDDSEYVKRISARAVEQFDSQKE